MIVRLAKFILLFILRTPGPRCLTNLILAVRYGARISPWAVIRYPFNVRLARGVIIGRATLEGYPWKGPLKKVLVIEEGCRIKDGAMLIAIDSVLKVGRRTDINPFCVLYSSADLTIGEDCLIAPHTVIVPGNLRFESRSIPIRKQGWSRKGIVIESDVWIGAGARILDGISIGKGAIVGAGSVVTKDVLPYSVVAGVPARKVKERP